MKSADLVVFNCNQLLTCKGAIPKRGPDLIKLGIVKNGCIASYKGEIVYIGHSENYKKEISLTPDATLLDAKGLIGLPGFVDSHTHLPFAGSREEEFALRLKGFTYQQLTNKGMGIQTSVKATRKASLDDLVNLCLSRLDSMLLHGTTTIEAKSGYGLNRTDEIKQLEAIQRADSLHPIDIIPTYLGAHEIPPEYKENKDTYIDFLMRSMLPEIKEKKLAEFFDVFCEKGVYSVEETRRMVQAAKEMGFGIKIHVDEFNPLGGTQMAVELEALSTDHLMAISDEGIRALAQSQTTATLLPGVPFFLMQEQKAPARALIDKGAIVALASDFNPGSSMTESMHFILQLGVFTLGMQIEECISACTANAAYSVARQNSIGSLEIGKQMDMILCNEPNYLHLAYHLGINPVVHVIKKGLHVVKNRQIINKDSIQKNISF